MSRSNGTPWIRLRGAAAALAFSTAAFGAAQDSYRIGEDGSSAGDGPVRMARFSSVSGKVDWRPTSDISWSAATVNLPIRQSASVWAPSSSRAEVQFDDGSMMRLAGGATATLVTMYSDNKGEFTEIKLTNGLATFHLTNKNSLYQIDTPTGSIKSYGPATIRVGDTSGVEVAVRSGTARFEGPGGQLNLASHQYLDLPNGRAQYIVKPLPKADNWDTYNEHRDTIVYRQHQYIPQDVAVEANDLDDYGSWDQDAKYGRVWYPHQTASWRPYNDGNWVWSDPYGWTWVGRETWGWTPYHYGTWFHGHRGWGWRPGPSRQCWSPAVVDYSEYNGNIAWCPLSPAEVRYPEPAVGIGVAIGSAFLSFSIGSVGCYYPTSGGYCEPYRWHNNYVNRYTTVYNIHNINNYYGHDPYLAHSWQNNRRFSPANARYGGGSLVAANQFGRGGSFRGLKPQQASFFTKGRGFNAPNRQASPLSGPFNARPVAASFTPSHKFAKSGPSQAVLNRQVYRSQVPKFAGRQSTGIGRTLAPSTRQALARGAAIGAAGAAGAAAAHFAATHRGAPANRTNAFGNRPAVAARPGQPNRTGFNAAAAARKSVVQNHGNAVNNRKGAFGNRPATPNRVANTAHPANHGNAINNRRGAFGNRTAVAAHAPNHGRPAVAARPHAVQHARPANRVVSHARPAARPARVARARAVAQRRAAVRQTAVRQRAVARRVNQPRRSFNRPAQVRRSAPNRVVNRAPRQSFSRPQRSSAPRQSFNRPAQRQSFSRPAPRQNFSRPVQRQAPSRPSAPRGGGFGGGGGGRRGGGGGGRRH